jgi:hypothetical protein
MGVDLTSPLQLARTVIIPAARATSRGIERTMKSLTFPIWTITKTLTPNPMLAVSMSLSNSISIQEIVQGRVGIVGCVVWASIVLGATDNYVM